MGVDERHELGQQKPAHGDEIALTLQHVGETRQVRLQPVLLGVPVGREPQIVDHRVDVVFELRHLTSSVDLNGTGQVPLGHCRGDLRYGSHLRRQVGCQQVHVAREILPGAGGTGNIGLAAKPAFHAHFTRHARDLIGKRRQRARHVVEGVGERRHLPSGLHGQALLEIAVGDGGHDLHDPPHLLREIGGHDVDVVGQVLPRAAHALNLSLATQPSIRAHFPRHARHLGGEGVELVDHRVDRVLQLEDLALHVDRDLAGQISAGDGRGDLGNVSDLGGQIGSQQVDVVRQVLPGTSDPGHDSLAAQLAVRAHLPGHACDFGRERVELVHHRVDGVL